MIVVQQAIRAGGIFLPSCVDFVKDLSNCTGLHIVGENSNSEASCQEVTCFLQRL